MLGVFSGMQKQTWSSPAEREIRVLWAQETWANLGWNEQNMAKY